MLKRKRFMTQQQKNRTAIYCRLSRDDGDGVDTATGENEFLSIKNIINEFCAALNFKAAYSIIIFG